MRHHRLLLNHRPSGLLFLDDAEPDDKRRPFSAAAHGIDLEYYGHHQQPEGEYPC